MELPDAFKLVLEELTKAQAKFPPMVSPHEGIAVIKEEFDELWIEIKDNKREPQIYGAAMTEEAAHVAAMAIRFLIDVCPDFG